MRYRFRPPRAIVAFVFSAALALAGCGTTASLGNATATSANSLSGANNGLVASPGAGAGTSAGGGLSSGGGGTGLGGTTGLGGASSQGGSGSLGGQSASGPGGASGQAGASGHGGASGQGSNGSGSAGGGARTKPLGVTPTTINIGVEYANNAGYVNKSIGAGNISVGNVKQDWQAVIDYVNKHGGIDGRRVNPIWFAYNGESNQTRAQIEQSACDHWTQDNKVFAVLEVDSPDTEYANCVTNQGGAAMVAEDLTLANSAFYRQFPYYLEPGGLAIDRIVKAEVPELVKEGYFDQGHNTKIGILTYDYPTFKDTVNNVFIPELHRYGYHNILTEYTYVPESTSELGQQSASVDSAALKFRQGGYNHILFLEQAGDLSLLFLPYAQSQHWNPRYGLNSQDFVQPYVTGGEVQKSQIVNAVGIGWLPVADLATWSDTGPYANPADRLCDSVMRAGGVKVSGANAEGTLYLICDDMFFFRQALNRVGPTVTRDKFLAAANATGSGFQDALASSGTLINAGQHDGVAKVHDYVYQAKCGCLNYTGPPINIG